VVKVGSRMNTASRLASGPRTPPVSAAVVSMEPMVMCRPSTSQPPVARMQRGVAKRTAALAASISPSTCPRRAALFSAAVASADQRPTRCCSALAALTDSIPPMISVWKVCRAASLLAWAATMSFRRRSEPPWISTCSTTATAVTAAMGGERRKRSTK
jgi:hypothetical protein